MAPEVDQDLAPFGEVAEVVAAMTILHHRTIMDLLQGKQHGAATLPHEAVEQDKSSGGLASGLGSLGELQLAIWLGIGINHVSQRRNRGADCSVAEVAMEEAEVGLEVKGTTPERAARGHILLVNRPHLQVDISAPDLDPRPGGRTGETF